MKRLIAACLLICGFAIATVAQGAPDAAELTKMLNDFLAGASKNDAAAHDRFWADDLIYTRSTGVRTTKAEIMKGLQSAPATRSTACRRFAQSASATSYRGRRCSAVQTEQSEKPRA